MADKNLIPASRGVALKTRPDAKKRLIIAAAVLVLTGAAALAALIGRSAPPAETAPAPTAAPVEAPAPGDGVTAVTAQAPVFDAADRAPADGAEQIARRSAFRRDGFPLLRWDVNSFSLNSEGRMRYAGENTLTGIDVSEHQYDIDWHKVAADGIEFAMIRVGYRGSTAGGLYEDEYFKRNISGALQAGLKVGVYFFSQAVDDREAAEEAAYVLDLIAPYAVTLPVVFDWEVVGGADARTYTVSREKLCSAARVFCDAVRQAGYEPMIYFTRYLGYCKYILRNLADYGFWYAEYEDTPRIAFDFDMWQYSETGDVDGVDGGVDLNILFTN